jgi:hypothetical protein
VTDIDADTSGNTVAGHVFGVLTLIVAGGALGALSNDPDFGEGLLGVAVLIMGAPPLALTSLINYLVGWRRSANAERIVRDDIAVNRRTPAAIEVPAAYEEAVGTPEMEIPPAPTEGAAPPEPEVPVPDAPEPDAPEPDAPEPEAPVPEPAPAEVP